MGKRSRSSGAIGQADELPKRHKSAGIETVLTQASDSGAVPPRSDDDEQLVKAQKAEKKRLRRERKAQQALAAVETAADHDAEAKEEKLVYNLESLPAVAQPIELNEIEPVDEETLQRKAAKKLKKQLKQQALLDVKVEEDTDMDVESNNSGRLDDEVPASVVSNSDPALQQELSLLAALDKELLSVNTDIERMEKRMAKLERKNPLMTEAAVADENGTEVKPDPLERNLDGSTVQDTPDYYSTSTRPSRSRNNGHWSVVEVEQLTTLMRKFGPDAKWSIIATHMKTRNMGQCARKWERLNGGGNRTRTQTTFPSILAAALESKAQHASELHWRTIIAYSGALASFNGDVDCVAKFWSQLISEARKTGLKDFGDQLKYLVDKYGTIDKEGNIVGGAGSGNVEIDEDEPDEDAESDSDEEKE